MAEEPIIDLEKRRNLLREIEKAESYLATLREIPVDHGITVSTLDGDGTVLLTEAVIKNASDHLAMLKAIKDSD